MVVEYNYEILPCALCVCAVVIFKSSGLQNRWLLTSQNARRQRTLLSCNYHCLLGVANNTGYLDMG